MNSLIAASTSGLRSMKRSPALYFAGPRLVDASHLALQRDRRTGCRERNADVDFHALLEFAVDRELRAAAAEIAHVALAKSVAIFPTGVKRHWTLTVVSMRTALR